MWHGVTTPAAARARALREARLSADLSVEEVAGRTGIDAARLRRFEAEQDQPSMPDLISIAAATGVSVSLVSGYGAAARARFLCSRGRTDSALARELRFFVVLDEALADVGLPAPVNP